jgi:hypothetical protein
MDDAALIRVHDSPNASLADHAVRRLEESGLAESPHAGMHRSSVPASGSPLGRQDEQAAGPGTPDRLVQIRRPLAHAVQIDLNRNGSVGISYQDARQLLRAKSAGASFDTVATIGRQCLYLQPDEALSLCEEFGLSAAAAWVRQIPGTAADGFFDQALNTTSLVAVDASGYEGAALILDMNEPAPQRLSQLVDAVIDGGSLEHIFNVPVALANLMRLVRVGGRVFIGTPSNNLCGHGFYQFSPGPEMMFRVFT